MYIQLEVHHKYHSHDLSKWKIKKFNAWFQTSSIEDLPKCRSRWQWWVWGQFCWWIHWDTSSWVFFCSSPARHQFPPAWEYKTLQHGLLKDKLWTCFLSFLGSPSESQDLLWCLLPQHQFLRQPEKGFLYVISVADCFLLKQYLLCPSQAVASSLKHPCPSKHLLPRFVKKCIYVSHIWISSPILIRRPWRSCSCPLSRPLRSSIHPPLSFLQVPSQLCQLALLLSHTAQHLSPVLKIIWPPIRVYTMFTNTCRGAIRASPSISSRALLPSSNSLEPTCNKRDSGLI